MKQIIPMLAAVLLLCACATKPPETAAEPVSRQGETKYPSPPAPTPLKPEYSDTFVGAESFVSPQVPRITGMTLDMGKMWQFTETYEIEGVQHQWTFEEVGEMAATYYAPFGVQVRFIHSLDLRTWAELAPVFDEVIETRADGSAIRRATFQLIESDKDDTVSNRHFLKLEY